MPVENNSKPTFRVKDWTDEEIADKFFIKVNPNENHSRSVETIWHDDFDNEINTYIIDPQTNDRVAKYVFCQSLAGKPLNYIANTIKFKLLPYVPEGYKLNATAIVDYCESVLRLKVNRTEAFKAANSNDATPFLTGMYGYISSLVFRGINSINDQITDENENTFSADD